jgi:glycosyltransferase involved in cell wall biosynthesis
MSGDRIRVAHVIDQLALAGAQRVLLANLKGLTNDRFEHRVYSVYADDEMGPLVRALGIPTLCLDAQGFAGLPTAAVRLSRELRRAPADIVHTQVFPGDIVGRVAAMLARTPVVLTTFQNPVYESTRLERSATLQNWLQWTTFRASGAKAIACSDAVKRSVRSSLGADAVVIRNTSVVDIDHWSPATDAERTVARSTFGYAATDFVIGCVARLGTQKGQTYLIQALARAVPSAPALRLLLIGDGPDRPELERLAADLGVADRLRVTGWLPDARTAAAACDAFALPSLWEGYGMALLEGMAMGLPYVASAVDGIPELATDDVSAILVPPADVPALTDALVHIGTDASLRQRLGAGARAAALRLAGREKTIDQLRDLYLDLVSSRRARMIA